MVANPLDLGWTDPRIEAYEAPPLPVNRSTTSEFEAEEVKASVRIGSTTSVVFTVDNLRFGGMEEQATCFETLFKALAKHLSLLFRLAVAKNIVSVPFKPDPGPMLLHPYIECIMQEQVGQKRTDDTSLWRSSGSFLESAICMLYRCLQPTLYVERMPLAIHMLTNRLHEQLMIYRVKETSDIKIQHPGTLPTMLPRSTYRIQC
jgi:hypothetical protein